MSTYTQALLSALSVEGVQKASNDNHVPHPADIVFDVHLSNSAHKRFEESPEEEKKLLEELDKLSNEAVNPEVTDNDGHAHKFIGFNYHKEQDASPMVDNSRFSNPLLIYNGVHILDHIDHLSDRKKIVIIDDTVTKEELNKEDIHFLLEVPRMESIQALLQAEGYICLTDVEEMNTYFL